MVTRHGSTAGARSRRHRTNLTIPRRAIPPATFAQGPCRRRGAPVGSTPGAPRPTSLPTRQRVIVLVILICLITMYLRTSRPSRTPVAPPPHAAAERRTWPSRGVPAHAAVMAKVSQHSREKVEFVFSVRIGSCRLHWVFLHSAAWTKMSGQRLHASQRCNLARTFFVYASEWMESNTELSISSIGQAVVTIEIEKERG